MTPPATVRCVLDGEIIRVDAAALGLVIGTDSDADGYTFTPYDNGQPITASEWPAWCEANRDRIISALAKPRQHQPTETGQLALLDHHAK